MQKGQYIVIKVEDIEKRIKICRDFNKASDNPNVDIAATAAILAYEFFLTNPKDLYSVVEDAYGSGVEDDGGFRKQDYLNNLEI